MSLLSRVGVKCFSPAVRGLNFMRQARLAPRLARPVVLASHVRHSHSSHPPGGSGSGSGQPIGRLDVELHDLMQIVYTCKVCETRSARHMSKTAYTKGVVLITCPGCKNNHLIADHLGWFDDHSTTVESILAEKGEQVARMSSDTGFQLSPEDLELLAQAPSRPVRAPPSNTAQHAQHAQHADHPKHASEPASEPASEHAPEKARR